ncbi:MAG: hypothetical protein JXA30_03690 [Deltaproteobacteria bacterium]|nr:hypothetical protein [Deltaproteobacteria bacterium]
MNWPNDYWVNALAPCDSPLDPTGNPTHDTLSMEHVGTTVWESVASFYGAAAFNSMDQTDCWFGAINCQSGQTVPDFPLAYMENKCAPVPPATDFDYMGVEIDWLRQLWRVRTANGINHPSTNDMLNWIDIAPNFNLLNGYQALDQSANTVGGYLNAIWDANKAINGIDW